MVAATGGTGTTTNGVPVAGWADQSGFGYDANEGTGANQPTYQGNVVNGQPVLRFDNVDDGMSVADALNLSDPYAVMTVFNNVAAILIAPYKVVTPTGLSGHTAAKSAIMPVAGFLPALPSRLVNSILVGLITWGLLPASGLMGPIKPPTAPSSVRRVVWA